MSAEADLAIARTALAIAAPALNRAKDALEEAQAAINRDSAVAAAYAQCAIAETLIGLGEISRDLITAFIDESEQDTDEDDGGGATPGFNGVDAGQASQS